MCVYLFFKVSIPDIRSRSGAFPYRSVDFKIDSMKKPFKHSANNRVNPGGKNARTYLCFNSTYNRSHARASTAHRSTWEGLQQLLHGALNWNWEVLFDYISSVCFLSVNHLISSTAPFIVRTLRYLEIHFRDHECYLTGLIAPLTRCLFQNTSAVRTENR